MQYNRPRLVQKLTSAEIKAMQFSKTKCGQKSILSVTWDIFSYIFLRIIYSAHAAKHASHYYALLMYIYIAMLKYLKNYHKCMRERNKL